MAIAQTVFSVERTDDYLTVTGLSRQSGAELDAWPLVLGGELIDNDLDGSEDANVPPRIVVTLRRGSLTVTNEGTALPAKVLDGLTNLSLYRTSKRYFLDVHRGHIGQGLVLAYAMPFVAAGPRSCAEIETGGKRYRFDVDPVTVTPRRTDLGVASHKSGVSVRLVWPGITRYLGGGDLDETDDLYESDRIRTLRDLLAAYALGNPHARLELAGDDEWTWEPSRPRWPRYHGGTCGWWYAPEDLYELLRALTRETPDILVHKVVAKFHGLRRPEKREAVLRAAAVPWAARLRDLLKGTDIPERTVVALLEAMRGLSDPVHPRKLGAAGALHLERRLRDDYEVDPGSVQATKRPVAGVAAVGEGGAAQVPFLVEAGFALLKDKSASGVHRLLVNRKPLLRTPWWFERVLGAAHIERGDPAASVLSVVLPRLLHTDPGKSMADMPEPVIEACERAFARVAKGFVQEKRRIRHGERLAARHFARIAQIRVRKTTYKEVVWGSVEEQYSLVAGEIEQANARQLYYRERPLMIAARDDACTDSYFTQMLLPQYLDEHPKFAARANICYDDRGHAYEPRDLEPIGIGTSAIAQYIESWLDELPPLDLAAALSRIKIITARGPLLKYQLAVIIEKEGFAAHIRAAQLAEKHDVLFIFAKGIPTTACRVLVKALSRLGIPVLVLHDFDPAGLLIVHTLRTDNRRFRYEEVKPLVSDGGLRLRDVSPEAVRAFLRDRDKPHAIFERFTYGRQKKSPREMLRRLRVPEDAIKILVDPRLERAPWSGVRAELNYMTTDQFTGFVESGILRVTKGRKVVPDSDTLAEVCRSARAWRLAKAAAIDVYRRELGVEVEVPDDLKERVGRMITGTPMGWDEAVPLIEAADAGAVDKAG